MTFIITINNIFNSKYNIFVWIIELIYKNPLTLIINNLVNIDYLINMDNNK
jgi:hypothetical protein